MTQTKALSVRATVKKLTQGAETGYSQTRDQSFSLQLDFKVPTAEPLPTLDRWLDNIGYYSEEGRQLKDAEKKAAAPAKTAAKKTTKKTAAKKTAAKTDDTSSSGGVEASIEKLRQRLRARYEEDMQKQIERNRIAIAMMDYVRDLMVARGKEVDVSMKLVQSGFNFGGDTQTLLQLPSGE